MDAALLDNLLSLPIAFSEAHRVPIFLDQWGIVRNAQGRLAYLRDAQRLLTARGIHWAYWQVACMDDSCGTVRLWYCCYYSTLYYYYCSGGSETSARWRSCATRMAGEGPSSTARRLQ